MFIETIIKIIDINGKVRRTDIIKQESIKKEVN